MAIVMRQLNLFSDPARHSGSSGINSAAVSSTYSFPWPTLPPSNIDPSFTTATSMAYSLDHNNVDGAEALLAQTETSDDYITSSGQGSTPPAGAGLYHLLDDLINTAPISSTPSASSNLEGGLGGDDPRTDIIKSGIVGLNDANVLVDQSVHNS